MPTASKVPDFLLGGGEMGERIRNFDWAKTPLGPPETWDQSLKTCVRIMLTSSQPIWIGWGKQLIKLYNDPYKAIVGGKHPQALGQPASVVWKDIWTDIEPLLKKVMEKDEGIYVESQLLIMQRYGYPEETYYTFSYSPVPGDNGGTAGMICYNTADTEHIITERSLQTLKELGSLSKKSNLEEVYTAAAQAIQKNNKDFPCVIIYKVDEEKKKATAFAFAGIEKDHPELPVIVDLNNPGALAKNLSKAIVENKMIISDTARRWKNLPGGAWNVMPKNVIHIPISAGNKKFPIAILTAALNPYRKLDDAYKNFIQLVADQILLEVNNVLALEEERKRAEALAEIDKAKTLFFTNISHEFRTPLTLMLGPLEEVLNDPLTRPKNVQRMQVAHRNAMRLLKLVNALLDFSRIESGRQKPHLVLTDLVAFTKNLASNFRSATEKVGLALIVRANESTLPVYIDRQMWEKIVFNLLSNAFKYTLQGNITVEINSNNNQAFLKVKDTGVGIPEAELPHMFERFHRIQNTGGRSFEGTGIGLSLTKQLVELNDGTINVESKEGVGSTFTVTIPFNKKDIAALDLKSEKNDTEVSSSVYIDETNILVDNTISVTEDNHKRETNRDLIMIVDDNADMRKHIENLLSPKYNIISASNGEEALKKLEYIKPELILSDIMMPVMDGIQLLKEIKNNKKTEQTPVILLTARAGEESKIEGLETGADDYLIKPFSSRELIARIDAQIKLKQKRDNTLQSVYNIFYEVPFGVTVLKGEDLNIEFINQYNLNLWQQKKEEVIGKNLFAVMSGMHNTLQAAHLEVYQTGKRYSGNEIPVEVTKNNKVETLYFNIIIDPTFGDDKKVNGLLEASIDVTEQVLSRKKIEKNEKQLVNIFKHAPVGIAIYRGSDFVVELANDQTLKMWGKTLEEVRGRSMTDIFPQLITQKNIHELHELTKEKFAKGETLVVNEAELIFNINGEQRTGWYSYLHEPLRDIDGNVTGIIATAIEVTDQVLARKKIEQTNRELEFSAIVSQSIADAVISTTMSETGYYIAGWNKGAEVMYGWKAEEVIGKSTQEVLRSAQDDKQRNERQRMLDIKGFWKGEVIQLKKDGTPINVLASIAYVKNKEGKILGAVAVNRNITHRKQVEESLRESETRFRTLAETLPQMVWVRSVDGQLEYASESWERYSGIKDIEVAWKIMTHPDDYKTSRENWLKDSAAGKSFRYEVRLKNKEGEYRWHYSAGEPVKDSSGKIIKWVGALTDIHVQKTFAEKLELEVAQRTDELVKANKELESFNYIASHDLQEPLRKIQTFITLIDNNPQDTLTTARYFDKIKSSAQRMSELIQSILSYSRLSTKDEQYAFVDLNKILFDVENDFELSIKEKNAQIYSDDLPVIKANPLQMHQLFSNLISNSLKFSNNQPEIRITSKIVTADKIEKASEMGLTGKYYEIIFADNGIGFDAQFKEQIFQLFQRLHHKSKYEGTGIGLSIVKKIVEQHNGFITADSSDGKGSAFTVWLPVGR